MKHKPANGTDRRWVWTILAIAAITAIATMLAALYIARPKITPVAVFIECSSCSDPTEIHPSEDSSDNAPTINVKVQNTGRTRAIILEINTTLTSTLDPDVYPTSLAEEPSHGYKTPFVLDSHSEAVLSQTLNETIVYDMRHPIPARQYERTFMHGHVKYRGSFWFPVTTDFCFQYRRPLRASPEGWSVCSL